MPTLGFVEEQYKADLQTCQVTTKQASSGQGTAFFYYYPQTTELHYTIYHDLHLWVTKIVLFNGSK